MEFNFIQESIDIFLFFLVVVSIFKIYRSLDGYLGIVGDAFSYIGSGVLSLGIAHLFGEVVSHLFEHSNYFLYLASHILNAAGFIMVAWGFHILFGGRRGRQSLVKK